MIVAAAVDVGAGRCFHIGEAAGLGFVIEVGGKYLQERERTSLFRAASGRL